MKLLLLFYYYSSLLFLLLLLFLVVVINLQAGLTFLFQLSQITHRNLSGMVCLHAGRQVKLSILGPKRLLFFFTNRFNLKGNCVLRTLKNSVAIF